MQSIENLKGCFKDDSILYSHFRLIKRKLTSAKFNRQYYINDNRFGIKHYIREKKKWEAYEKYLIVKIREKAQTVLKLSLNVMDQSTQQIEDYTVVSKNGDSLGKVITFNGEFYRGIYGESLKNFLEIWNTGVFQALGEEGILPKIQITKFRSHEFPLIIHMEKVFILHNTNWSYAMIKDACILISVLKNVTRYFGLTLLDGHLQNITFYNGHAVFIDIGSFILYRNTAVSEELTFCGAFRLLFRFLGNCALSRMPVNDDSNNNIFVYPRFWSHLNREYQYALKILKRYYLKRGNLYGYLVTKKLFDLYNIEPAHFELLFPVKKISYKNEYTRCNKTLISNINLLGIMDSINCIGDISCDLEKYILDNTEVKQINHIDFNEDRLDQAYLSMKGEKRNINFFLYNYIYAHKNCLLEDLMVDCTLCFDPLYNIITYQPTSLLSILEALKKLSRLYVILDYYPNHPVAELVEYMKEDNPQKKIAYFESNLTQSFNSYSKVESNVSKDDFNYHILYYISIK